MTPLDLVLPHLDRQRQCGERQWSARCPAHPDCDPSLRISVGDDGRVLLHCRAGCTLRQICVAIGIDEKDLFVRPTNRGDRPEARAAAPTFSVEAAQDVWNKALERARDDDRFQEDRATYTFLRNRQLEESWEHGAYGILAESMDLPHEVADWPRRGYRLVAALHDLSGQVVSVQSRRIWPGHPKTLLPKGSRARGTTFATQSGRELLRNGAADGGRVLLGEGLTDFLALSIAAPVPVLSVPGASFFATSIGPWSLGQDIYLAADNDDAGEAAIQPTARAASRAGAGNTFAITWPEGCNDACDALSALGPVAFAEFLEHVLVAEEGAHARA